MQKMTFLLLLMSSSAIVIAQDIPSRTNEGVHRAETGKEKLADLYARLHATADQKTALKKMQQDTKNKIGIVKNDTDLSASEKMSKVKIIRKEQADQLQTILNPAQQIIWNEYVGSSKSKQRQVKNDGEKSQQNKNNAYADNRMRKWDNLHLNAAQKTQMVSINENNRQALIGIKNDPLLTEAQKEARIKVIKKETRDKRKAVLTSEQRVLLKENNK